MVEPTVEQVQAALARHASRTGEVFPSALKAITVEEQWSGRLWDVLGLVAADVDTMRYAAGGDRPAEITECAERWAESGLRLDDIALVLGCGGYDPDPFVTLSGAGLLRPALCHPDGTNRLIDGERAGTWISDELALATAEEIVERTRRMMADTDDRPTPASS